MKSSEINLKYNIKKGQIDNQVYQKAHLCSPLVLPDSQPVNLVLQIHRLASQAVHFCSKPHRFTSQLVRFASQRTHFASQLRHLTSQWLDHASQWRDRPSQRLDCLSQWRLFTSQRRDCASQLLLLESQRVDMGSQWRDWAVKNDFPGTKIIFLTSILILLLKKSISIISITNLKNYNYDNNSGKQVEHVPCSKKFHYSK